MPVRDCPYCREEIKVGAIKCWHCKSYVCKMHGLVNIAIISAVPLAILISASMIVVSLGAVKEGIRKGSLMRLLQ